MNPFNIYLAGVGGQGIGLLSEILLRAGDHAGLAVKGVDTHGLAQRGGIVVSGLRFGNGAHSPLIGRGKADLVVALERHEALRAMTSHLKKGGTLVYYDAVWQPPDVRLKQAPEVSDAVIREYAPALNARVVTVFKSNLADVRMQNIVLLAHLAQHRLVPDIETRHFEQAMEDLLAGDMLKKNLALLREVRSALGTGRKRPATGCKKRQTKKFSGH